MKSFTFSATRTRLQSAQVTVRARTEHEAEGQLVDLLDGRSSDDLAAAAGEHITIGPWSDGEDEGEIEYDCEGSTP